MLGFSQMPLAALPMNQNFLTSQHKWPSSQTQATESKGSSSRKNSRQTRPAPQPRNRAVGLFRGPLYCHHYCHLSSSPPVLQILKCVDHTTPTPNFHSDFSSRNTHTEKVNYSCHGTNFREFGKMMTTVERI